MRTRFADARRVLVLSAVLCCLALLVSACAGAVNSGDALKTLRTSTDVGARTRAAEAIAASLDATASAQLVALAASDPSAERYVEVVRLALAHTLSSDSNPARREAAARSLGAMGPSDTWDDLATATEFDKDPIVRMASAGALAAVAGTDAVEPLRDSLVDETEERVLQGKADLIAGMPGAFDAVLSKIGDYSLETSEQIRVARVARSAGAAWVAKLCKKLGGADSAAAEVMLSEIGKPAVNPLIKLLKSKKSNVRFAAASALVQIERNVPGTVNKLTGALKSKSLKVIAQRLGRKGTEKVLRAALLKYGTMAMALDYLNCGKDALDAAARVWAGRHGYYVYSTPGYHSGPSWGEGV
jgi:HEAT repeat protein